VKLAVASIALLAGCAQILGLENTELDRKDAGIDAPDVCDRPAFACDGSVGRTVCGRLFTAVTGEPYRVAEPTGQLCTSTEGPCGLTVFGQSVATYDAGTSADRVPATVDDCGYYAVPDFDAAIADVAIGISGSEVVNTARLLLDRPITAGSDTDVDALVVPTATPPAWATQLGIAETDIATGYLIRFVTATNAPVPMEELRISGAAVGGPPTVPWASYFIGRFDMFDPALTATTAPGTAFVGPPAGSFRIGGFHPGKTCGRDGFQAVNMTLIYAVMKDC
jgi:hypothetical protein